MQQYSTKYIFGFAAMVCLVCSLMLSVAAVGLRSRQEANKVLDKRRSVLQACWLAKPGERVSVERTKELFGSIEEKVLDMDSYEYVEGVDPKTFEPPMRSVPPNPTQLIELPGKDVVYLVTKDGKLDTLVLPIRGKGLWSTLKGFLAMDEDGVTVRGLTYYEHGETPGLGGEVDNPKWKAKWPGRKAYDESGAVKLGLAKGPAGSVESDPHRVDGLSGATLTCRGITNMVQYWLGDEGYGPYLKKLREGGSV